MPCGLAVKLEASKVVPSLMPVVPSLDKVQREKKKMMIMTTTMITPDKREAMFGTCPKQKRNSFSSKDS
jgi:hypothetical protein